MSKYIVPILFIVVGLAICVWHFVKPSVLEKNELPAFGLFFMVIGLVILFVYFFYDMQNQY